jgi:hypothetical protein
MTPAPLDTNRIPFWPPRLSVILTHKLCEGCGTVRNMPRSFKYCASCLGPQRLRDLQREARSSTDRGEFLSHFTPPCSPLSVGLPGESEAGGR